VVWRGGGGGRERGNLVKGLWRGHKVHSSDPSDFAGSSGGDEPLKKRSDHWIELDGCDSGHIQDAPDVGATPDDHPLAAEGAAITGPWGSRPVRQCDADPGGRVPVTPR